MLEDINEDVNKWRNIPHSGIGEGVNFPPMTYRFNALSKSQRFSVCECFDKLSQKFTRNYKRQ